MSNQSRKQELKFHISQDDYFGTLATVLSLLKQATSKEKSSKEDVLENIENDLMFLQRNYRIIEK